MNKELNLIDEIIEKNLIFLAIEQEIDGSFLSFTSLDKKDFSQSVACQSIFSSTLILSSLTLIDSKNANAIKGKLARLFLLQKSSQGTFNYWKRESQQARDMPYPDDLDDTACALAALYKYDPKFVDENMLVDFVKTLTFLEETEGGPYRSWLVPANAEDVWNDIDLAVNSNAAFFLSLNDVELENIVALVEEAIDKESFHSPYYPDPYSIIYFISRWYHGSKKDKLINYLLKENDELMDNHNPLNVSLISAALMNLGYQGKKLKKNILYLINEYQSGDSWKAHSFYTGINPYVVKDKINEEKWYAGSAALTTAFCLEVLGMYKRLNDMQNREGNGEGLENIPYSYEDNLKHLILKEYQKRLKSFSLDFQERSNFLLEKILLVDEKQPILFLPYFFAKALDEIFLDQINEKLLVQLGLANLYGWMAYTIYDDFLDQEADEKSLPLANVFLRELIDIFGSILPNGKQTEFNQIFQEIMDKMEESNFWEVSYCRVQAEFNSEEFKLPKFGDYSSLAQKSMGHSLSSLALLFKLGFIKDSKEVENCLNFFKHYLIARQLDDDIHDWEKDLKSGHVTPVVKAILKKSSFNDLTNISEKDLNHLQEIFWQDGLSGKICKKILSSVDESKKYLKKMKIVKHKQFLLSWLEPIEKSAQTALEERKKVLDFLVAYES